MWWLARTALPLVLAGMTAKRYAALRGPALWLALVRGVGVRTALPALVLLSIARSVARKRAPAR